MQTKEIQGKLWSAAPADWAHYLEPSFVPLYQAVLKELDLDEEKTLLDAGCGAGLFLTMAEATGAFVYGIDAAPGLLAISRQRLPGATLLIEDLESLPFGEEIFDVVTGFNSFQYAGSFERALKEAARVTKQHGRIVIAAWGKEEDCDATDIAKGVASLLPPPKPGTPNPFVFSEEGVIELFCEKAGLKVISKGSVACPWQFKGVSALQDAFLSTGPCVKAMEVVSESKVRKTILRYAQPYKLVDDIFFLRNHFNFFITEKL